MALQTVAIKNALCTAYATATPFTEIASTAPGSSPGTPVSGPARSASNWGTSAAGSVAGAPAAFAMPSSSVAAGVNMYSASTGGTYEDGGSVTSQPFSSAGTYTVTLTYTQS